MKLKISVLITLLTGCFFYAQEIIVKDSLSGIPLEKAVFESSDRHKITETNHLGKAVINNNAPDSLVVMLDKYTSKIILTNQLVSDTINTVYLKHEIFKLNSIVVTGSNWKLVKSKSSAHIGTLAEKQIDFENRSTTADLLESTNEIFVQKSQLGGGSPMIRGFATNRILISVDGVNMNNAIFRSGNIQNILGIDPNTISKMDYAAGPGSVLYGSDAIGGVLSFETKSVLPTLKPEINGSAEFKYGTAADEKSINAGIQFSSRKWTTLTSFSHSEFGDLMMGKNGPDDYLRYHYATRVNNQDEMVSNPDPYEQKFTAYKQQNFLQKIGFYPGGNFNLTASFSFSETSDVPRYDRLLRYRGEDLRSAEWYYGPQQWIFSHLTAEFTQSNRYFDQFKSILAHQYFTESRHDRDLYSDIRTNRFERVNVYSWDNNFVKKLNAVHQLFYGFDIRLNHVNSAGNDENIVAGTKEAAASRYPDGSTWNQLGLYTKLTSEIFDNFMLETGLRYSYVNSTSQFSNEFYDFPFDNADFNDASVTGKTGFNYKIRKDLNLNLHFATGFRAPNIDDISKVFDSEPGSVVVPNPKLQPEYIYSFSGGIKKTFGQLLYLHLLGYYSWLDNALVRRNFELNGQTHMLYDGEMSRIQALQNASEARVYGGFAQVEINLHNYLKFLGTVNYTHGTEELDDGSTAPLRHAAPLFGNTALEFERKKLKLKLHYNFNAEISADKLPPSERDKDYIYALNETGEPYVPAWSTLNLQSQYQFNQNLYVNFSIENIFNKLYRSYSSGISAPGRNFVISLRTIF